MLSSAELLHHNCHHQCDDTPLTVRNSKWSMWTRPTTHNNNTHQTCLGTRLPRNKLAGTGPDPSRSLTISLLQTGAENVQLNVAGVDIRTWPTPAKKSVSFNFVLCQTCCTGFNKAEQIPAFKLGAFVPSFVSPPPYITRISDETVLRKSYAWACGNCLRLRYVRWCISGSLFRKLLRSVVGPPAGMEWARPWHEILHDWNGRVNEFAALHRIKLWSERCIQQHWDLAHYFFSFGRSTVGQTLVAMAA